MQKIGYNKHVHTIAELCKGSTRVSESLCLGSIPSSAAKKSNSYELDFFIVSKRTTKSSVPALFDKLEFTSSILFCTKCVCCILDTSSTESFPYALRSMPLNR